MKKIAILLLSVLFLISCSVQKRKYQKGFYISWKHAAQRENEKQKEKQNEEGKILIAVKPLPAKKEKNTVKIINAETDQALALTNNETGSGIRSLQRPSLFHADDPCDKLVFKDGKELSVKLLEITQTEIRYKKCALPDGPVYVARKAEISMVQYANGTREVFENTTYTPQSNARPAANGNNSQARTQPFAIISLICGILGLIPFFYGFLSVGALVFGSVGLRLIREYPETYKGRGLAIAGKILGIIGLVITAIILIFIIALIFSM